jgi:DNA polymerase III epsilon subunit-like protein
MPVDSQKVIFFDLETAGLNPRKHPIIQLAAIAVDEELSPLEAFEVKIQFDLRRADKSSLRKNHYHPGRWAAKALPPREAAEGFAEFLRRHATFPMLSAEGKVYHVAQLVAHNASFDGPFLQAWFEKLRLYLPARYQVACTMQRAIWFFNEHPERLRPDNWKLATLCQHFGLEFHAADAHEALADVSATVRLYGALLQNDRTARKPTAPLDRSLRQHPTQAPPQRASHAFAAPARLDLAHE